MKPLLPLSLAAALAAFAVAACSPGSAEKAGENADSAYEETTQGEKNLTDGPMENAGEAVDAARADAAEAATDARTNVEKAIDNADSEKKEPK
jgi:hypothetical protein